MRSRTSTCPYRKISPPWHPVERFIKGRIYALIMKRTEQCGVLKIIQISWLRGTMVSMQFIGWRYWFQQWVENNSVFLLVPCLVKTALSNCLLLRDNERILYSFYFRSRWVLPTLHFVYLWYPSSLATGTGFPGPCDLDGTWIQS